MFEELVKTIKSLNKTDRIILSLYFVENCTEKEIAKILNLSTNEVKLKINTLLKNIKTRLKKT